MSRRFTGTTRDDLYYAAEGRCQMCGTALGPDWHADHKVAWSKNGPTTTSNGQALCPDCNRRKGAKTMYNDTFKPRRFQSDVITAVLDGINFGRPTTVVMASPGSGKTLAYQAVATELYRAGVAPLVAVYTPRLALAQQCETGWLWQDTSGDLHGEHKLFDPTRRIGRITHVPNRAPLTRAAAEGCGFVTTFAALTTKPDLHLEWARQNEGQFLLVIDEAQFCGADGVRDGGGTQAGARVAAMARYAAHTILLTGTPYRSDDLPLVLAEYEEAIDGHRKLVWHAEATYRDGIADHYLRQFDATLDLIKVKWKNEREYDLSTDGSNLMEVLRKPETWQPIVDEVVAALRERQLSYAAYRGLIMCMEQQDAVRVLNYLRDRYPSLKVDIAISDHAEDAEDALRKFKVESKDILVTVKKAFIGYNCPEITVVGLLTHYRHYGFLDQGVGRGLRVIPGIPWEEQVCRIIAPDDPGMVAFIDYLRTQQMEGLRVRADREGGGGGGEGDGQIRELEAVRSVGWRALSNETDVSPEQLTLVRAAKAKFGLSDADTKLAQLINFFADLEALPVSEIDRPEPGPVPMTAQETIQAINNEVRDEITEHMRDLGHFGKDPGYGQLRASFTTLVNGRAGVESATTLSSILEAQSRLDAVRALRREIAEL